MPRTTPTLATAFSAGSQLDAERMTRLTQSLLMLARVEAEGRRDPAQVVDVTLAAAEAAEAAAAPEGVEMRSEIQADLVAEGPTRCSSGR